METLKNLIVLIFVVSFFYAGGWEIFRGAFVRKRYKEYADGLRTNFTTAEELMQVIRSMNCFLVKQVYYNEDGNVEVQGKYGKHRLNLENGVINVVRSKEDSGRNYKYIVEENTILDYIAKEENHALALNPYEKYKKAIRPAKLHKASLVGTFAGLFLLVAINVMPSGSDYVDMVKYGSPTGYPEITYGEAFGDFFSNTDWKYFKSSEDKNIVEFTGKCMYGGETAEFCFQFEVDDDDDKFSVEYFGIDGESQNILTTGAVLDSVFSSYEETH